MNPDVIQTEQSMLPDQVADTILGDVTLNHCLDEKHAEYSANVNIWNRTILISIYSDPETGETDSPIRIARSIVQNFAQHKTVLLNHLEHDFCPRFRKNSGTDCSLDDLVAELDLHNITVHANGKFSIGFNTCETLHDHCLVVYFSNNGHVEFCDTPG